MTDVLNIPGIATLSSAQLRAILKQKTDSEKKAKEKADAELRAAFATVGEPLFSRMLETVEQTDRDNSEWAGRALRGIPFEVQGHRYTMSVTVTDVERVEQKKAELEASAAAFLAEQTSTEG